MRVKCDRKALAAAVNAVKDVCPKQTPLPIIQSVLLRVDPENGSAVWATDLEVSVRHRVVGVEADGPLDLVLPREQLSRILDAAKGDEVLVGSERGSATLRIGQSLFTLPTPDPSKFPAVRGFDFADYWTLEAKDFLLALKRTSYACRQQDETGFTLTGCLWDFRGGELVAVGTDGHHLALQKVPAVAVGTPAFPAPIVPKKALKLFARLVEPGDAPVHVAATSDMNGQANGVFVRGERSACFARCLEGQYPKYERYRNDPAAVTRRFTVRAEDLASACAQANVATAVESRGILFEFAPDTSRVSAEAAEVGAFEGALATVWRDGAPVSLLVDNRFLPQMLATVEGAAELQVAVVADDRALEATTDDGLFYLVQPLEKHAPAPDPAIQARGGKGAPWAPAEPATA